MQSGWNERSAYAVSLFLVAISAVRAGGQDITVSTNLKCGQYSSSYVYTGRATKGQLKGQWADYVKRLEVEKGGITTTLSNPVSNWNNSTIDVLFRVSASTDWDYEPDRGMKAYVEPILQPSFTKEPGSINLLPPAVPKGASVPTADYYETVDVTITGDWLNGANVATAKAVVDDSHAITAYAGEMPRITNGAVIPAAVLSAETHKVVVRLSLPQKLSYVTLDIKLTGSNADKCTAFGTVPGADPPQVVTQRITMGVAPPPSPPYVQRIDVVNAVVGKDAEFTLTLNKPVPRNVAFMFVTWKVVPESSFSPVSTSPLASSRLMTNRVSIGSGESVARFKMHVTQLPAGAINVGTAYVQTWIGDTTRNVAPYFFQKDFTISAGN